MNDELAMLQIWKATGWVRVPLTHFTTQFAFSVPSETVLYIEHMIDAEFIQPEHIAIVWIKRIGRRKVCA